MNNIDLFFEEEQPNFDRGKRQKDIGIIKEHFNKHKEELGRVKVISPDRNTGEENRYSVSCDKRRYYTVLVNGSELEISPQEL